MTISVVIATYKHPKKVISAALKKWVEINPHQVILCDDNIRKMDVPKGILYLKNNRDNRGLEKNCNQALPHITGDYTLYAMGDSVPDDDILKEFTKHLTPNTVACGIRIGVNSPNSTNGVMDWRVTSGITNQIGPAYKNPFYGITGNGLIIPTKALQKVEGWSEDYPEHGFTDYDLGWKLYRNGLRFKSVKKAILYHVDHPLQYSDTIKNRLHFLEKVKNIQTNKRKNILCLDFHDFNPKNHGLSYLKQLKEHYPKLKITMFMTPMDVQTGKTVPITEYKKFCETVEKSDWLEVCLHGFAHNPLEFRKLDYKQAAQRITVAEKMFENVGITLKKIFCAPYWEISDQARQAVNDAGYRIVERGEYNWDIRDSFPTEYTRVWGHGHIQNTGNGIEESFNNLLTVPTDYKWVFLSDYLNEEDTCTNFAS